MPKKSNFDKPERAAKAPNKTVVESPGPENSGPAPVAPDAPKPRPGWASTLFGAGTKERLLATLQRKNLPRMVKAVDADGENIPVDGVVLGVIVDVVPSPVSTIKGSLLWLALVDPAEDGTLLPNGRKITFPAVGTVRAALAPGVSSDEGRDNGQEKARKAMLQYKGYLIALTRQPDKLNAKYKKAMGMWDVRVSDGPVDLGVKIH